MQVRKNRVLDESFIIPMSAQSAFCIQNLRILVVFIKKKGNNKLRL